MDKLIITSEEDLHKIIKEALAECLEVITPKESAENSKTEPVISRNEVAKFLGISLVTLTDWMKRGLPFHKVNGRVFFQKSEVIDYVKSDHLSRTRRPFNPQNTSYGHRK